MKKIEAILKPFKLDDVCDRLSDAGLTSITVTDARGFGRAGDQATIYPGAEYVVAFVARVKVEVVVPDAMVQDVIDLILDAAHTGEDDDGELFVVPVFEAVRIATRQRGQDALF